MEHNLLTIKDVAAYLQLAEQTVQTYVRSGEIPFHKIKKVIRFRFSEIERWVDSGGLDKRTDGPEEIQGDLFANEENETAENPEVKA